MNSFRGMGLGSGIILAIIGIILFAFPTLSTMVFAMLVGFGILVVGTTRHTLGSAPCVARVWVLASWLRAY